MKILALVAWALFLSTTCYAEPALQGQWKLAGMIYRGAVVPPLNPKLNLLWTFYSNGTERLYWDRDGEPGFCERFATFEVRDGVIKESVFAVNPNNARECGQDPDMQVGRETKNHIEIQQHQVLLHLQLGEEELVYILKEVL